MPTRLWWWPRLGGKFMCGLEKYDTVCVCVCVCVRVCVWCCVCWLVKVGACAACQLGCGGGHAWEVSVCVG